MSEMKTSDVKERLDLLLKESLEGALSRVALHTSRVAVACSGGADSMALTDALARLAPERGLEVVMLTVSHGLYEGAEEVAEGVCAYWRSRGVESHHLSACAELIEQGRGVEEGARRARYAALEEARCSLKLSLILLAHHADDQAETLLKRLQGPTGARGLAGIPEQRGQLLRPWLAVERKHLKTLVSRQRLPVFEDPTNTDERFVRNRLRSYASPALERVFGEGWVSRAQQSAAQVREHVEGAQWLIVEQVRGRALINHHRIEFMWTEGLSAPISTQRLVLLELWRRVLPRLAPQLDPRRVQEHLTPLWEAWVSAQLTQRQLPYGLWAWGRGGHLIIDRLYTPPRADDPSLLFEAGPRCVLAWGDWALTLTPTAEGERDPHSIPLSRAPLPWRLRAPKEGERFQPLGAPGSKPLRQLWGSARRAPVERERLPVLVDGEDVPIWAPSLRPSEQVRGGAGPRWSVRFVLLDPLEVLEVS